MQFSLKIWHLVAPILLIFLRIKLTRVNACHFLLCIFLTGSVYTPYSPCMSTPLRWFAIAIVVNYLCSYEANLLETRSQFHHRRRWRRGWLLFLAMTNLDKLKLWDKQIRVTPSKHTVVQMPKEGQPVCSFASRHLFSMRVMHSAILYLAWNMLHNVHNHKLNTTYN